MQAATALVHLIHSYDDFNQSETEHEQFMDVAFEVLEEIRGCLPPTQFEYDRDKSVGEIKLRTPYMHVSIKAIPFELAKSFKTRQMCLYYHVVSDMRGTDCGEVFWVDIRQNSLQWQNTIQHMQGQFRLCKRVMANPAEAVAAYQRKANRQS